MVRIIALVLPLLMVGPAVNAQQSTVCGPVTYDKGLSTTETKFSTESLAWTYGAYDPSNPFYYPPSKWYGSEQAAAEYAIPFEILGSGFRDSEYDPETGEYTIGGCSVCENYPADFCLYRGSWDPASNPSLLHGCTAFKMKEGYSKSAVRHPDSPVIIGIPGGDNYGIPEYKMGGNGYSVCEPGNISGPTAQIVAVPGSVQFGQSSSLQYKCTESTSATITAAGESIGAITQMQGSRTVTPTADTSYVLTCTGPEGTATASTRVSVWVLPSSGLNLTAMAVAALDFLDLSSYSFKIPVNMPVDFASGIMSVGGYNVPGGVTHAFELRGASNNPIATDVTPAFGGAYNTSPIEFTHTFTSEGTYYLRACADSLGMVAETSEADNCGPWATVQIGDGDAGSVSCQVSDTTVAPGESVTYTATPSGAASGPYTWTATGGGSGFGTGRTATRTFSAAGSYGMQVTAAGAPAQATCPAVIVTEAPLCPGTKVANIDASPLRVRAGQTTTVTWSATAIDTNCVITGPGYVETVTAVSCVIPDGRTTRTITTQSQFTISCDNGAAVDSVIVNVIPEFEEF